MVDLKKKPVPKGFNKKKLIMVFAVLGAAFAGALIYVTSTDPTGGASQSADAGKAQNYAKNDVDNGVDDIVNSKPIGVPSTNSSTPTASAPIGQVPPISQVQGDPNVSADNEQKKAVQQLRNQAQMKQLQAKYAAYSSKTGSGSNNGGGKATASGALVGAASSGSMSGESGSSSQITGATAAMSGVGNGNINSGIDNPTSPYTFQAGGIIPSVMISGINSELNGEVIAQVRENVYDSISGKYLVIPQGSKLIGVYNSGVAYGDNRLMVAWNRLIYPNGSSINLKGQPGTDIAGYSGFYDQVDNHYWSIFGTSFIMGVITGAMQLSQNNTNPNVQVGGIGVTTTNPSAGQTISGSLGQQLGQTGMMIAQKGLNVAPTITIRQGYTFNIMTTADLILKPYKQN